MALLELFFPLYGKMDSQAAHQELKQQKNQETPFYAFEKRTEDIGLPCNGR